MPANGGNRWRLSRWLTGGFFFYWLLRCTLPQLAVAWQKILVPFIACLFITNRLPVVLLFVNTVFILSSTNYWVFDASEVGTGVVGMWCCALSGAIAPVESYLCHESSVNCSSLQGHIVRKVCRFCNFGTIPLPRNVLNFSPSISLVVLVLLVLTTNLLWQNGKAFVTKKVSHANELR